MKNGNRPNRARGLGRAEKSLKLLAESFEQLHTRDNHTPLQASFLLSTALLITRLVSMKFSDMALDGVGDTNRRARLYVTVFTALTIFPRPITVTYLSDMIGSKPAVIKPLISSLLQSGYLRQSDFHQNELIHGVPIARKHSGLELTAKGHDKVKFILSKLTDQRIFPIF